MKKVTIINAYGDKNIGDAAILSVALKFVREAYKEPQISVLCEDTKSYSNFIEYTEDTTPYQLPYGYAIRGETQVPSLTKIIRFITIYLGTFFLMYMSRYFYMKLPQSGFYSYITAIKSADIVIGMGGGYFTTNNKFKDYFGLMLSLLTVYVAKFYHKKIVFFPLSFGPFASQTQQHIAYHALKSTTLIARDYITLNQVKKLDKSNKIYTFYAPDLALFYGTKNTSTAARLSNKNIILTAREWFSDKHKQDQYEDALAQFIDTVGQEHGLNTLFIPMARNPIEDDDNRVAERLKRKLKNKSYLTIRSPRSLGELQQMLQNAKIAVCTRMHSSILSCTVGTPFIAIGYGHKTLGFVKSIDLEEWHIDIADVQMDILYSRFNKLIQANNYNSFIDTVTEKLHHIQHYRKKILSSLH